MYAFIKSYLPTKENEQQVQESIETINETVEESKQEVESVEKMEFDLSLGINQTSGKLNELEAERDKVFKTIELIDNQLKLLSGANLSEQQAALKEELAKNLEEKVRPSVLIFDKQIDILTRKLLILHNKRDLLTQKKVSVEDAAEDAQNSIQQVPTNAGEVPMDSITSEEFKNDNNKNNPESNV
ncbi:hypothetical protein DICPUDRAFT_156298 [Dictyostelium purpureum]|uniref:Uncharacterized protein n=1 Tax=Dictyostelium purpureum TaxID=5786 RepID=F0ZW83_DICPU|nr:uncharacterized protein DICPUDRAFT_156298 [Dictyostelium purpureum]EGC31810.1 hypothetical protein DICPUDRAFT_156298 [Dictyostelium purpureum]|eukprot:XP_003291677.1 hypothetical protein DICPUDRAFT_156298 [Dictyostelium purpureum]